MSDACYLDFLVLCPPPWCPPPRTANRSCAAILLSWLDTEGTLFSPAFLLCLCSTYSMILHFCRLTVLSCMLGMRWKVVLGTITRPWPRRRCPRTTRCGPPRSGPTRQACPEGASHRLRLLRRWRRVRSERGSQKTPSSNGLRAGSGDRGGGGSCWR